MTSRQPGVDNGVGGGWDGAAARLGLSRTTLISKMRRSVPRGADAPNIGQRWLKYTGLPAGPALEGAWTSAMHADDGERVAEYWREIVAGGAAGEIEARLRRYDALARES